MASKKTTRGKGEGGLYKDDAGYWTAVIELPSHDGTRRRKKVRSLDKRVAATKLAQLRGELETRGDLPTADQTVGQWFKYWFEEIVVKEVRPKTAAGYKSVIFTYIIPIIGAVKLSNVTAAHVRRVTDHMTDKGLSSTYALNAHRIMSSGFEIALREGRTGRNPAKLTSAPRKAAVSLDVLSLSEGIQVLDYVSREGRNGAKWATALLTGARRGEVLGLEMGRVGNVLDLSWQLQRLQVTDREGRPDVPADFEYRHLTGGLYLTRPKSNAGWRIIPLVDPLRSILERHIEENGFGDDGLLFRERGRPIDPDQHSREWKRILLDIGIEKNVRLHDLRHTAVDMLYLAGVPEDLILEIVGHSTRTVTRGYKSRGNEVRLHDAMTRMSALFTQQGHARSDTPALNAS